MKLKFLAILLLSTNLMAQTDPEITSWLINTSGQTGYGNILSNVQQVQYSANNVYITCTSIPDYTIGPWPGNPNTPTNQNFLFKITRNPIQQTGAYTATPLGHIGTWTNGVSIFNAKDAISYNNQNIWHQDARYWEGSGFDNCLGHPAPGGEYHLHVNPTCLYDDTDSTQHSPIIGYAFDGFPIYGAYGFDNTNGTGPTRTMISGYQLRSISSRTTLPDGTVLNPPQYGPAINTQYPLGAYIEDYEYVPGLGDLDEHNGRFCVTPEYPNGIYAYFVTLDYNQNAIYPYTIGPTYYGTVQSGNTGPGSGHNTISEPVTVYIPGATIVSDVDGATPRVFPNPATDHITISMGSNQYGKVVASLYDMAGKVVVATRVQSGSAALDVSNLHSGVYLLRLSAESNEPVRVIVE